MFIHQQLSVWQVGIELGDIGLSICNIRSAAEVIRVIEEDVLSICRISWDITISRLGIIRTFWFTPLDRRFRCCIQPSGTLWSPRSVMMLL